MLRYTAVVFIITIIYHHSIIIIMISIIFLEKKMQGFVCVLRVRVTLFLFFWRRECLIFAGCIPNDVQPPQPPPSHQVVLVPFTPVDCLVHHLSRHLSVVTGFNEYGFSYCHIKGILFLRVLEFN